MSILRFALVKAHREHTGVHWITVTKDGPVRGRHLLMEGDRIVGGAIPRFFHGKTLGDLDHQHLRQHWVAHQRTIREAERYLATLEKQIRPLSQDYARMTREGRGPRLYDRIKEITGGHMISSAPRHVGDLTGEFRESIPRQMKRQRGGIPIDEVASMLGMDSNELLEAIAHDRRQVKNATAKEFMAMAERDIHNGDEYRIMTDYLKGLKAEAGSYRGPAPRRRMAKSVATPARMGLRKSNLSDPLKQKLAGGTAHWVTVKEGPLEGRHLLIDGPRPAKGDKSHGRILAGQGIPAHVIEKITGATHAHHLEHDVSEGPDTPKLSQWLTAQGHPHETASEGTLAGDSHRITLGHGHRTQTVKNRTTRGTHEETAFGHLHVGVRAKGGFALESAFEDKDALKADGARWDVGKRQWYAPDNATLERILHDRREFPDVTINGAATHVYEHPGDEKRHYGFTAEQVAEGHQRESRERGATQQQEAQLPALHGSDKQIAWAKELRAKLLVPIRTVAHDILERKIKTGLTPVQEAQAVNRQRLAQEWLDRYEHETSAKWWIDHRDHNVTETERMIELRNYVRQHAHEPPEQAHGLQKSARNPRGVSMPPILAFSVTKGYLTTAYGQGRAPTKTPDAGKRRHQTASIDATTSEESLPTIRLNGFTPNVVWALLRRTGYKLRITEGQAMLPGQTTVRVTSDGATTLHGPRAAAYAAWFNRHLRDMVDWGGQIDGKQEVSSIRSHGGHFS